MSSSTTQFSWQKNLETIIPFNLSDFNKKIKATLSDQNSKLYVSVSSDIKNNTTTKISLIDNINKVRIENNDLTENTPNKNKFIRKDLYNRFETPKKNLIENNMWKVKKSINQVVTPKLNNISNIEYDDSELKFQHFVYQTQTSSDESCKLYFTASGKKTRSNCNKNRIKNLVLQKYSKKDLTRSYQLSEQVETFYEAKNNLKNKFSDINSKKDLNPYIEFDKNKLSQIESPLNYNYLENEYDSLEKPYELENRYKQLFEFTSNYKTDINLEENNYILPYITDHTNENSDIVYSMNSKVIADEAIYLESSNNTNLLNISNLAEDFSSIRSSKIENGILNNTLNHPDTYQTQILSIRFNDSLEILKQRCTDNEKYINNNKKYHFQEVVDELEIFEKKKSHYHDFIIIDKKVDNYQDSVINILYNSIVKKCNKRLLKRAKNICLILNAFSHKLNITKNTNFSDNHNLFSDSEKDLLIKERIKHQDSTSLINSDKSSNILLHILNNSISNDDLNIYLSYLQFNITEPNNSNINTCASKKIFDDINCRIYDKFFLISKPNNILTKKNPNIFSNNYLNNKTDNYIQNPILNSVVFDLSAIQVLREYLSTDTEDSTDNFEKYKIHDLYNEISEKVVVIDNKFIKRVNKKLIQISKIKILSKYIISNSKSITENNISTEKYANCISLTDDTNKYVLTSGDNIINDLRLSNAIELSEDSGKKNIISYNGIKENISVIDKDIYKKEEKVENIKYISKTLYYKNKYKITNESKSRELYNHLSSNETNSDSIKNDNLKSVYSYSEGIQTKFFVNRLGSSSEYVLPHGPCYSDLPHIEPINDIDDVIRILNILDEYRNIGKVELIEQKALESTSLLNIMFPKFKAVSIISAITLVQIAVYITSIFLGGASPSILILYKLGALWGPSVLFGQYWRLLSAPLLHGSLMHLYFNLMFQLRFGYQIESVLGSYKMIILYLFSAIFSSLISILFSPLKLIVGASSAGYSLLGAMLWFQVLGWSSSSSGPLRTGWWVLIMTASLVSFCGSCPVLDLFGHLGGIFAGFLGCIILMKTRKDHPQVKLIRRSKRLASVCLMTAVAMVIKSVLSFQF